MALAESVFLTEIYRGSCVCLVMLFVSTTSDVGVTQRQQQQQPPRDIANVSRVIENLLETYDIRLRPRFGGKLSKDIRLSVLHGATSYVAGDGLVEYA